MSSVFEHLTKHGHDAHFIEDFTVEIEPTQAMPGSEEKVDVLRKRVELGAPLWHSKDRNRLSDEIEFTFKIGGE